jgi:hypothetical protein
VWQLAPYNESGELEKLKLIKKGAAAPLKNLRKS